MQRCPWIKRIHLQSLKQANSTPLSEDADCETTDIAMEASAKSESPQCSSSSRTVGGRLFKRLYSRTRLIRQFALFVTFSSVPAESLSFVYISVHLIRQFA